MKRENAGGGDYKGLPTKAIKHRNAQKHAGLPWDRINADYIAAGGQVDASVWPKTKGKVHMVMDRNHVHTIEERTGNYEEPLSQGEPKRPTNRAALSPAKQREVALKYRHGGTIPGLANECGVSVTSIRTALKNMHEPIRSRGEANRRRAA